MTSSKDEAG